MIALVPATVGHVALMQRRLDMVADATQLDRAITVLSEEEPLCCWGVTTLWPGVGVAWLLERQRLTGHPYASRIARAVRRTWEGWSRDFRYVEALVMADRPDSQRLIAWCGFMCTARKEGYGPGGETMLEYTWRAADAG